MDCRYDEALMRRWCSLFFAAGRLDRATIVKAAAHELGLSPRHFYRLVPQYRPGTFAPKRKSGQHGSKELAHRLADEFVEKWLDPNQPTIISIYEAYKDEVDDRSDIPKALSLSAFKRKVSAVSDKLRFERRGEANLENVQFATIKGHSPRRSMPLEAVQIDHTQLDIDVIDRFGSILGRPWFTAVIDEYTRALLGFYVSLLPPQRFTVGMALARAIFPKDEWLASLGVEGTWEMHGVMAQIGSDNGSDLAADDTIAAYRALGVTTVDFRPKGEPQYGAIIERYMGTIAELAKGVPGYTGPNWTKKPKGKSKAYPCLTLDDLETYLARWAVTKYNQRSVGRRKPPAQLWREAAEKRPHTMSKHSPFDRDTTEKLFLPSKPKTVTAKGIEHLYLQFRSSYLDQFLKNSSKASRSIQIRLDPRTIMEVYHHDSITNQFIAIPLDEHELDLAPMSWKEYERDIKPLISKRVVLDPGLEKHGRLANRQLIKDAQNKQALTRRQRREAETQARYKDTQAAPAPPANDTALLPDTGADDWLDIVVLPNVEDYGS